jgi:transposase
VAFREVDVIEVKEVLRGWLAGQGLRTVAARAGVDRKTARRYVQAAQAAGLVRDGGEAQLSDGLLGEVVAAVRPERAGGHGVAWQVLEAHHDQLAAWIKERLTVAKIAILLQRQGVVVPYRTLHRYCVARCGFGATATTVRVADGEPGMECQLDFARMGLVADPQAGRRRVVHALIFTAVVSRHLYVYLTFSQTLEAIICGCEAAWRFFDGVFRVLVVDNTSAIVCDPDPVNPRLTVGWLDYAQHCGFATDTTRVAHPKDKPRVERVVQYVRGNFFAGEHFCDLADAQAHAEAWCLQVAGLRLHGTTHARPAVVFAEQEAARLLPVPDAYDVPVFASVKVHRDHHVEVAKALYSVPATAGLLGQQLQARADSHLVKLSHHGHLVKVHPRQQPGRRSTDPDDLPVERSGYAMRDLDRLLAVAAHHGPSVGVYARQLLAVPLPWTRMRQVYRLLGLARRYGPAAVDHACARALEWEVVSVAKIASMLERTATQTADQAIEHTASQPNVATTATATARFARDPAEFTPTGQRLQLTLLPAASSPEQVNP